MIQLNTKVLESTMHTKLTASWLKWKSGRPFFKALGAEMHWHAGCLSLGLHSWATFWQIFDSTVLHPCGCWCSIFLGQMLAIFKECGIDAPEFSGGPAQDIARDYFITIQKVSQKWMGSLCGLSERAGCKAHLVGTPTNRQSNWRNTWWWHHPLQVPCQLFGSMAPKWDHGNWPRVALWLAIDPFWYPWQQQAF